ncbi:hypothetical protein ACN2XU_08985 [Primorskyibacter sp. 2E107]|uniref:hypothetical protein n=1 Tax=Primorskyibacter sp. 2E107 TaxID=3403458 RepID=UPI003AF6C750
MKLEFLLCGSANDGFFSQMAFFRKCLDHLGGDEAAARLVCVFGDHDLPEIPARWQPYFANIDIHWAHEPGAENRFHVRQHNMRFDLIDPNADVSFICDADVAPMRSVAPLAQEIIDDPALTGAIAHYHFPRDGMERDPQRDWEEIALAVLGKTIPTPYRYTLLPEHRPPLAPFYINFGVFAGTPELLRRFHARDMEIRPMVEEILNEWWAPQVSIPLTCADLDLPVRPMPMRWNFPNDEIAEARYPEEAANIGLLHYLRPLPCSRSDVFADRDVFEGYMEETLNGTNAVFQAWVRDVTGGVFPFP